MIYTFYYSFKFLSATEVSSEHLLTIDLSLKTSISVIFEHLNSSACVLHLKMQRFKFTQSSHPYISVQCPAQQLILVPRFQNRPSLTLHICCFLSGPHLHISFTHLFLSPSAHLSSAFLAPPAVFHSLPPVGKDCFRPLFPPLPFRCSCAHQLSQGR